MSKRTIKHYLNKRLHSKKNEKNILTFPLYCEIIYNKKSYQFKSKTAGIYLTEKNFTTLVATIQSKGYRLLKKDLEIIDFCAERCTNKKGIFNFSNFKALYETYSFNLIEIVKDYTYYLHEIEFSPENISGISLTSKLEELKKYPFYKKGDILEAIDLLRTSGNYHSPIQLLTLYFAPTLADPNKSLNFFVIDWIEGNVQEDFKQYLQNCNISENEQKNCLLFIDKILEHFLNKF